MQNLESKLPKQRSATTQHKILFTRYKSELNRFVCQLTHAEVTKSSLWHGAATIDTFGLTRILRLMLS